MIMKMANRYLGFLLLFVLLESAVVAWRVESFDDGNLIGAAAAASPKESGTLPLKLVADIELPGPTTRFDYQSYDPRTHLLFIAHLAAGTVVVFNTESNKVVAEIPGISQVHGVLAVPDLNSVYASATGTNEIVVIDEKSLKEVARIPGGVYPDGMTYAPEVHKLYVSDQAGKTETVIDTRTNKRITTISLGGEAGNSQYDPVSKHVFVNVQTRRELAEIDTRSDTVVARYPLPGAGRNHGLLIEPSQRLAFIACEDNAKLLVVDMKSMKVVLSQSVGEDPDVLAFDAALHLLYVASESGVVSIFKEQERALKKIAEGLLADKAHSVAVDQQTHRVYFPLQNLNGRAVLRIMEPITTN
jgi:YVTN family beta-propeller protein